MGAVIRNDSIKTAASSDRAVPPKRMPSRAPALRMLPRQQRAGQRRHWPMVNIIK